MSSRTTASTQGQSGGLRRVLGLGVEVLAYGVRVTSEEIGVDRRLDVLLD